MMSDKVIIGSCTFLLFSLKCLKWTSSWFHDGDSPPETQVVEWSSQSVLDKRKNVLKKTMDLCLSVLLRGWLRTFTHMFKEMLYYNNKTRNDSSAKSNPFSVYDHPKSIQSSAHVLHSSFTKTNRTSSSRSSSSMKQSNYRGKVLHLKEYDKKLAVTDSCQYWQLLSVQMIHFLTQTT